MLLLAIGSEPSAMRRCRHLGVTAQRASFLYRDFFLDPLSLLTTETMKMKRSFLTFIATLFALALCGGSASR